MADLVIRAMDKDIRDDTKTSILPIEGIVTIALLVRPGE
jgi:hypothetical protein